MGMRVSIGGAFRFWYFCRNFCEMKAVIPAEKILITVPDTVWLILYLIHNTACSIARATAERTPPRRPIAALLVRLPTSAANMHDISIIPSIAILMVPERSARMPEKAARVIGTANKTALESMPERFKDLPLACQTRKPKTSSSPHKPTRPLVARPKPFTIWNAPIPTQITAKIISVMRDGNTQSAKVPTSIPPGVMLKVVINSGANLAAKRT